MKTVVKVIALLCFFVSAGFAQHTTAPPDITVRQLNVSLQSPPQSVSYGAAVNSGNPGPATYYYWIVSNYAIGNSTPAGPFVDANAPNTLSVSNGVTVSWRASSGATSYDVLRTSTSAMPVGACNCAVATAVSSNNAADQSNTLNAYTVSTLDPSTLIAAITNQGGSLNFSRPISLPPFNSIAVTAFEQFSETTDPACLAGFDFIWGSSADHRAKSCGNGGTASDLATLGDFAAPPAIGNTTANTGVFTSLQVKPTNTVGFDIDQTGNGRLQGGNQAQYCWTSGNANGTFDTGFSRDAPGVVDVGNCNLNDASGTIKSTNLQAPAGATLQIPTVGTKLISDTATQTLTNKTLTSPTTTGTDSGTETLTNKTLTAPVISTISNTGTLTLPTSTDTLVGKATTDTLSNKTLASPAITGALVSGSGYARGSVATCAIGTGVGAACSNTITWSSTLSSSTYNMLCEMDSPNTTAGTGNTGSKTTTTASVSSINLSPGIALSTGTVRCIAIP
ncbi:MAG TPA: hypothetical protein VH024_00320 [Candidatus Angelobacter sp.]|jgi:hypothetical protein|nr:hypothetical protein [Candidatus Angelobacter sp.]